MANSEDILASQLSAFNGIVWAPQTIASNLQYDPINQQVTAQLNLQFPATEFGPEASMFRLQLNESFVSNTLIWTGSGSTRTMVFNLAGQLLGLSSLTLATTSPLAVVQNPATTVINTGGFE